MAVAQHIVFRLLLVCACCSLGAAAFTARTISGRRVSMSTWPTETHLLQQSLLGEVSLLDGSSSLQQDRLDDFVVGSIGNDVLEGIGDYFLLAMQVAAVILVLGKLVTTMLIPPEKLLTDDTIGKIVAGTFLDGKDLKRVYKASRDGWSALAFHNAVDGEGSGLVAVRGLNGKVFGGYNPSGWRSTDDYCISSAAFLWCLKGQAIIKLPILSGGNCAIFDYSTAGPTFGSTDFVVGPQQAPVMGGFAGPDTDDLTTSAGNLRQCRSVIGTAYRNDPAWPARGAMQLVEVEVYCAAR